jgi:hypothetical protein
MRSIFLLIFFFFTSCTSTHITGQYIDDSEFSTLNSEGKDRQSVMKILGSPTFAPENDPNTWYYISRTMKTGPLSKPKLTEQRIIKLSFDNNGTLINVETKTDTGNSDMPLEKSSTFTQGKSESSLQHFIKNFGRFNTKREKKR